MAKYARLRARVIQSGLFALTDLCVPHAATDEEISRVHTAEYLARVQKGLLTEREVRRIGLPWSPAMVERSRRSSGATIEVCRAALDDGCAVNLAGGTHHAFADHGEGYCVFNDSAIAARMLQAEGRVSRIVILDADVHQGNGTARIFFDDPTVFTFSIHGAKNFPFHKEQSDLDVELADATGDQVYLDALENGVRCALQLANAELAIYLAGADPFAGDQLGRLAVTKSGLAERDRIVFDECKRRCIPIAVTMAGGYGRSIDDTVDIHMQTVHLAVTSPH